MPVNSRIIYAGTEHVDGSRYKNESFGVYLRREKGYQVALFGKGNFNTYEGFDRWFQGAFLVRANLIQIPRAHTICRCMIYIVQLYTHRTGLRRWMAR